MTSNLHNESCLFTLSRLYPKSIDLVLTSPPYNMNLRLRNGKYCSRQIVKELSTKYDNFDDNLPMDELYTFHEQVISSLLDKSKIIFYNIQLLTGNRPAFLKLMGRFHKEIKEVIVWDKTRGEPSISERTLNSVFELVLVLTNEEENLSRRFKQANFPKGTLDNIWRIPRERSSLKSNRAVFPTKLAELVISNFTNENDVVYDPFMGTGTTGLVCKQLKRRFIGSELDLATYLHACKRLNLVL